MQLGAFAVFDDAARRWHLGEEVLALPTPRPRSYVRETSVVLETDAERMFHTRGLKKFGRPDVLFRLGANATDADVAQTHPVLDAMLATLASGRSIPLGPVEFEGRPFEVVPYRPGENAPDVKLENDGLLVLPARPPGLFRRLFGRS